MVTMPQDEAKALLEKYTTNDLSEEEKALVEKWLLNYQKEGDDLSEEAIEALSAELWDEMTNVRPKTSLLWKRMAAAACLTIGIGLGLFFYAKRKNNDTVQVFAEVAKPIVPGGNKAILTLADGSQISLTDADKGELASQSGIRISKTDDGQLVYQINDSVEPATVREMEYNSIETPRGGQYQINLPDGSRVWLNAASRLTFPLSFASLKERKIELRGEAYFEVAKDVQKPFVVQADKQSVQVLGTHFNVNAYSDEPMTKTTLLEGSVKIQSSNATGSSSKVLVPGQQSQISSTAGPITIKKVDPEAEVAWKNGQFFFENEPIENIMRQIARWYDVEIIYEDDVAGKTVWGSITRFSNVSKVLSVVEKTGKIHFKVQGRRVIVSK